MVDGWATARPAVDWVLAQQPPTPQLELPPDTRRPLPERVAGVSMYLRPADYDWLKLKLPFRDWVLHRSLVPDGPPLVLREVVQQRSTDEVAWSRWPRTQPSALHHRSARRHAAAAVEQ